MNLPPPLANENGGEGVEGVEDLPPLHQRCDWANQSHCQGGGDRVWEQMGFGER